MFEIKFVDCWDEDIPSYYIILKDGQMWSPYSYRNEWDAIADIRLHSVAAAHQLEELYSSVE